MDTGSGSGQIILPDYNPLHGGLMLLGLAFLFCTPMLVSPRVR